VGLAAPQIGVKLPVMVFGFDQNSRYPSEASVPLTALINPQIDLLTDKTEEGLEGCLSIPCMRGSVPRATHIRYRGISEHGCELVREAWGFHARIVRHKFDHLNGVLYPQRIADMTKFGFIDALFPHSAVAALEAQ
jgi:peptide deformylase